MAQQDALDRLDAIQTLANKDNPQALKQLQDQAQLFMLSSSYEVKREYLSTLISVQIDAAHIDAANTAVSQLMELAKSKKDDAGWVMATAMNASMMALAGKTDAAIVQMLSIETTVKNLRDPAAQWNYYWTLGRTQNTASRLKKPWQVL